MCIKYAYITTRAAIKKVETTGFDPAEMLKEGPKHHTAPMMTHVLPNAVAYLCLALTLDLRYSVYEQVVLSQGSKLLRLVI